MDRQTDIHIYQYIDRHTTTIQTYTYTHIHVHKLLEIIATILHGTLYAHVHRATAHPSYLSVVSVSPHMPLCLSLVPAAISIYVRCIIYMCIYIFGGQAVDT